MILWKTGLMFMNKTIIVQTDISMGFDKKDKIDIGLQLDG